MTPVWGVEEEHVGPVAGCEPAEVFGAEGVRRVGRAGAYGLGWVERRPVVRGDQALRCASAFSHRFEN